MSVEYHHVVFTVPDTLHPLFLGNPKQAYDLLFAAVSETLREVALRPRNLGARIGFSALLHTWTQTLLFHPHLHCIVTGGGLHPDGTRWISAKPGFLFAVRILGRVFGGKLLDKFEQALHDGAMRSCGEEPNERLRKAALEDWVVYSKPPLAGPEQVLDYFGRYAHRVAISNERLVSVEDAQVSFRWKDRAHGNQAKLMRLDATEFMRRFLLHVLPRGLRRIRHYRLLSNPLKRKLIPRCRELLGVETIADDEAAVAQGPEPWPELLRRLTGIDVTLCPKCGERHLVLKEDLPVHRRLFQLRPTARSP